jgi:DHA3 family macrolide efflux protein-like MFS transporter
MERATEPTADQTTEPTTSQPLDSGSSPPPPRPMRPFFIIWTGQAFSLLGSSLVSFALIWWLTETTGSATVLTTAAMVAVIPAVVLSPITGTLVDRWNRRRVLIVADGAIALTTLALAILFTLGVRHVAVVYVVIFIASIGGAFHRPAMIASTSLMIPEQHYSRIAGLNNALRGAMSIVAPPTAALLLRLLPIHAILYIDVITAAVAIAPLLFIAIPQPARSAVSAGTASVVSDMLVGLRFIVRWPGLLMLIGVYGMVHLLFAPSMALMPLLVTQHFGGGAQELGWLQAAAGAGLILGGLALGAWGGFRRRMATAMLALALVGCGMLAIGIAPASAYLVALAGLFLVGFALSFVTSLRVAVLQASIPPEIQGRVITVALTSTAATDPIGLAIAGPLADALGVQVWYVLCGIITVAMGIGSLLVPAIMRIEERVHPELEQEAGAAG